MRSTMILLSCLTFLAMTLTPVASVETLLPDSVCSFCEGLFRAMGCLEAESTVCRVLALKFQVVLDGQKLCGKFMCEPIYGSPDTGHQCKGQLQCLITKRRPDGICPIEQICCAP